MPNDDTIKLLRECDSGSKMAVQSINEVKDRVDDSKLSQILEKYLADHEKLGDAMHEKLNQFHDEGKEPGMMATTMSWLKTEYKLLSGDVNSEVAELMTDGCNMGIKSLARYINQYATASKEAKDFAYQLIDLEEQFMKEMRVYL